MRNFPTAAGSLRDFSLRIRLQTTEIWSMPWGWNLCLKSGKDNWSFYFVLPHHNPFRGQLEYYLTTCFYCKEPASHPCFVLLLCMTYHFQHSCLILWHQNVQYHWDSLSSSTDLTFPLGFFLWAMAHGKTCSIYSADSPEPNTDCIPPQHCPKADATYFTVPPVSLFVVNLYHFRGTFLWHRIEKKILKCYFQKRIEELTEPKALLVKNLLPLEDSS